MLEGMIRHYATCCWTISKDSSRTLCISCGYCLGDPKVKIEHIRSHKTLFFGLSGGVCAYAIKLRKEPCCAGSRWQQQLVWRSLGLLHHADLRDTVKTPNICGELGRVAVLGLVVGCMVLVCTDNASTQLASRFPPLALSAPPPLRPALCHRWRQLGCCSPGCWRLLLHGWCSSGCEEEARPSRAARTQKQKAEGRRRRRKTEGKKERKK